MQRFKLPDHESDHIEIKERNHVIHLVGTDTITTPVTSCGEALRLIAKGTRRLCTCELRANPIIPVEISLSWMHANLVEQVTVRVRWAPRR